MHECRRHQRCPVPLAALLRNESVLLSVVSRNISFGGALLYSRYGVPKFVAVGIPVTCKFMLHAVSFDILARVARKEDGIVALEFEALNVKNLQYLHSVLDEYLATTLNNNQPLKDKPFHSFN